MMRASVLLLLLLAACDQGSADGYAFERKEFERTTPAITIVTHASLGELRAAAPPEAKIRALGAWSVIRPNGCEVHVVDPAVAYLPEMIGHEVTHCVWRRFHG